MQYTLVLCAVLACLTGAPVTAAPFTISGTVRDVRLQPIPRATVRITEAMQGAFTDVRGWFRLDNVVGDSARLTISCVGYVTQNITVVSSDTTLVLNIVLGESSVLSRGIVVTSYRAGELHPVTQTTVTREAIDRIYVGQDPQYIIERTVPSVVAYSESGTSVSNYGTFRIRGIDQTRVNVTLDGTPLNDMIDQGVFFSNMADLSNGLRSVQVQRGTGMSTNGTASYAGSVNFEGPSLATPSPSTDIQLTRGSFDLWRGSAALATGKMDNNVSVYARFTTLATGGYRENTGTTANSFFASGAWFGTTDVVKLTVVWGSTQNELGYYPVPKPLADKDPTTNLNDSSDVDDFGQSLVQLQHSHAFSESAIITTSLYAGRAGGDFFSGYRDTSGVLTQINYPLENRQYGGMSTLELHSLLPWLDITAGVHAYTFRRRNWETMSPESARPYYDDRTTKNEVSGFARGVWRIGHVEAFADLQVRQVNLSFVPDATTVGEGVVIPDRNWTFINPRLGLRLELSPSADVYSSFGRTGREPTRFDLLGSTQINSGNLGVLQDPNRVRAEYVNDFELGARMQAHFGHINLTGFLMMFTDEIAPIGQYIEQQFVQLRKNVPSSRRMGIEIEGSLRVTDEVWLDLVGTWMRANIDTYSPDNLGYDTTYLNVDPILTPKLQATATVRYRPVPSVEVQASMRHIAQSFTDLSNAPSLILPSFTQVDLRLWWTFLGQHRVGAIANNIFGAFIVTNGGTGTDQGDAVPTYFMQATQNFAVMIHLHF